MPLQRRVPKRGFNNIFATEYAIVNVSDLNDRFEDGATVNAESLVASGLLKKTLDGVKILGKGEITKALTFRSPPSVRAPNLRLRQQVARWRCCK